MTTEPNLEGTPVPRALETGRSFAFNALWDASIPMAMIDWQLRVVALNGAMEKVTRQPADAQTGRPAEEVLREMVRARELRTTFDTGLPAEFGPVPFEAVPGSGEVTQWLVTYQPVRTDGGEVLAVCLILTDVTHWRRAEEAARESRAEAELAVHALIRLQAVTGSLAAALTPADVARIVMELGVGLLDAAAGSISRITERDELEVLDAFGYPERALVAWRRYATDLPAPLAEAFRAGQAVWIESRADHAARFPHAPAAGPFQGASVAVPLSAGGRLIGVLGIDFDGPRAFDDADRSFIQAVANQAAQALDRARLYEQQEALRERAEHTAALLDTMFSSVPIGLAFVDWNLRFVHVNAAWGRLYGTPAATFLGRTATEVLAGLPGADRAARWRSVLESGEPALDVEDRHSEPGEPSLTRIWLESCHPVLAGNDTVGLAVVARDITAARRAENFRRNLMGIVGHDLRNPLSAILGWAHLLKESGRLDEPRLRIVGRLEQSARRATHIAHDLLDLTRIETKGGIPVELDRARVDEICRSAIAEVETVFAGRGLQVTGRGDPNVRWDSDRVGQALSNLVVNALKHGAQDRPVAMEWGAEGDVVSVHVHNWGPPVPAPVREHLGEPFRQGTHPEARASGVGLGLYIASEIARSHGGSIDAHSDDVGRTTFTLTLPRDPHP
jgi:PAS domain S-box-containing protein